LSGKLLIRYGEPVSAIAMAADAAAAKTALGVHGMSVILRKPPSGPHGQAEVLDVTVQFAIVQTGKNRSHYTVELPDPVTQEVTDQFNAIFQWFKQ
jgi:hypothetical protein